MLHKPLERALVIPCGIPFNSKNQIGQTNPVLRLSGFYKIEMEESDLRSRTENHLDPFNAEKDSSKFGKAYESFTSFS